MGAVITRVDNPFKKKYLLLGLFGLVLNMLGSALAHLFGLSLYLDTIGTFLVGLVGGYLPAVLVAECTNILNYLFYNQMIYYGAIDLIIALYAGIFAIQLYNKKNLKPWLSVILIPVISGTLCAIISWFLGGGIDGNYDKIAISIQETTGLNPFWANLARNYYVEFIDKFIIITIATFIFWCIPQRIKDSYHDIETWQGTVSKEMEAAIKNAHCRRISIRLRVILVLLFTITLISFSAIFLSSSLYKENTIEDRTKIAYKVAESAAGLINPDDVDDYIKYGREAPNYKEIEEKMYIVFNSHPDVEYLYVYRILPDGCHVVFDLDSTVEASSPGDVIPFDESFEEMIPLLLEGKEIDPIISRDTYGYLLSVYIPLLDSDGVCQCYVCADISMKRIDYYNSTFMVRIFFRIVVFFLLSVAFSIWIFDNTLIHPINTLSYMTNAFAYGSREKLQENVKLMEEIRIRTGDEVENLYTAISKTTFDSMNHIFEIREKSDQIAKMQNGLIMILAEIVESRDENTGNHIRKTAAYVKIIAEEMKQKGYYTKEITKEFITNVVNAAPLHDVGKIHVSDTILNKPGKLTSQEFEIMKTHTTYGRQILDYAIKNVSDSGYLHEAKNMAEFHHEKWDGTGYPYGIRENTIPLSARVMAVADVFDALVSKRAYKEPFPFDEAVEIIKEGSSKYFDPLVVDAFISAIDKVKRVFDRFSDNNSIFS